MFIQKSLQNKIDGDLPIFIEWLDLLKWILATTDKFPKKVRFTFSDRINTLALNVVEDLTEARYTANKSAILKNINLKIEKIRVLFRVCYESQFLSQKNYEHGVSALNRVGKSLGAWRKQQDTKEQNAAKKGSI